MVCGNFKESLERKLAMDDVDKQLFMKLLQLACGEAIYEAKNLEALLQLAELSERLQMNAVTAMLEDRLIQELTAVSCLEMLARGEASGLKRLQDASYELVCMHFVAISKTEAFLQLSEETMDLLLGEDELGAGREEEVFDAVVRWTTMNGKEDKQRGSRLLTKIRFGAIGDAYLAESMIEALPGHDGLKQLVAEAIAKKGMQVQKIVWDGLERLSGKWLVPRSWKGRIFGCGSLKEPRFAAIDCHGRFLVSDGAACHVVEIRNDGSIARYLGEGEGQFKVPAGIAMDRQGNMFVADSGNHRVQMFDANGSFVRCFGSFGAAVGQLSFPEGVAIDLEGRVVVVDRGNDRIQVFNPDGTVASHFGSRGDAVGQLREAYGVAVDGAGRMVVADSANHRVQVFNSDGSVALCFGSLGSGPGQLQSPAGVAVDREGRLVVADYGNHRIQVFDASGGVVKVVGKQGSGLGEFRYPAGVAVDSVGRVLVADHGNGGNGGHGGNGGNGRVQLL